tara:strand:- start:687 stop:860 length:174 start_codon:yes stop_codon:yes gene_type:complete
MWTLLTIKNVHFYEIQVNEEVYSFFMSRSTYLTVGLIEERVLVKTQGASQVLYAPRG